MSGSKNLFGTDGIRGIANEFPMTPEVALRLGKALAYTIKQKSRSAKPKVILGKDTRLSGYIFEQAISSGLTSMGVDVYLVGPLPTPAIAFLTKNMRADAGLVISASHNPYTDNGIKIFDRYGFKLADEKELQIENLVLDQKNNLNGSSEIIGKAIRIEDATGRYVVFVKKTFPDGLSLEGLKIVVDCANGAAYKVAPTAFRELGAEVISLGVEPDGMNINTKCGSLNPELLIKKVLENKADIGIALDGDADRVIISDEKGTLVDGDKILAISTEEMINRGQLKKNEIVATLMSNMGIELFLKERGIKLHRTDVGDRYVVESMKEKGINLGGEQSGHIIFLDHTTTGDGILASLQVLAIMKRLQKPLSSLVGQIEMFPQVLKNVKISEKPPIEKIPGLNKMLSEYENKLGNRGRINIRYSGTESLARVMVEGEDKSNINSIASKISDLIGKQIGL
ncbi:MAG: phosphoglucosamine mutase [Thermodesulfobacteriota bacterium]